MSLLGYGDNLISLALLAKLRNKSNVKIIGTTLTQVIAPFIPNLEIPIILEFDNIPAFYDVRRRGITSAINEAKIFATNLTQYVGKQDTVVFEQNSLKSKLLSAYLGRRYIAPPKGNNVYEDTQRLLQQVFDEQIDLKDAAPLPRLPCRVTINPTSRWKYKAIANTTLEYIISYFHNHQCEIHLLDPQKEYLSMRHRVGSYHSDTSLKEAGELVKGSELYIGADSLFSHFSYHFGIPFVVVFNRAYLYFSPPGVGRIGNYIESASTITEQDFYCRLDKLFSRGTCRM